ncbi:MAG: GAF domain-containing protein [Chloroflexota bacterium]
MQAENNLSVHNRPNQDIEIRSRRAIYISIFLIATVLFFGSIRAFNLQQEGEFFLNQPFAFLSLAFSIVSFIFGQRKRPDLAGYTIILSLFISTIVLIVLSKNGFTLLSGAYFAVITAISTLVIPTRNITRNILLTLAGVSLFLLIDQFAFPSRPDLVRNLNQPFSTLSLISLFFLFIYIFTLFNLLAIRNKILIAIIGIAIFSIALISSSFSILTRTQLIEGAEENIQQIGISEGLAFGELLLQQVRIVETAALNSQLSELATEQNNSYGDISDGIIYSRLKAIDRDWRVDVRLDNDEIVGPILGNEPASELRLLRETYPGHAEIYATDRYGGLIAATNKTNDFYQADEDWWQLAYNDGQGGLYIGDPKYDISTESFAVVIAVPILDRSEDTNSRPEVVGVLQTTYQLESLNALLEQTNAIDESASVNIFVNGFISIIFTEEGDVIVDRPSDSSKTVIRNFNVTQEETQVVEIDGQDYFSAIGRVTTHENLAAIDSLNWFVIVSQQESEVLANVNQQTQTVIVISIVTVFLSTLAASFVGNLIVSPITRLTSVAQRIESGDRLARAEVLETDDEVKNLSVALNSMTDELNTVLNELELRVANRTRSLEIASNVSRELSSILELDQLLASVVNLVRDTYDYYHAQIYLWNEDKTKLIMRQGTGEVGEKLLARSFFIQPERGLVGQAGTTGQPVYVPNVRDPNRPVAWIPNADLPDTISEIVVPIFINNEVAGVLDVQEDELGKMTVDDLNTLQLVANQIGVAIQNAQVYEEIQKRAEQDNLLLNINQKIQQTDSLDSLKETAVSELQPYIDGTITPDFRFLDQNGNINGTGAVPILTDVSTKEGDYVGHFQVSNFASLQSEEKELVWAVSQQLADHAKILHLNESIEMAFEETARYSEQLNQLNDLNIESNALASAQEVLDLVTHRIRDIMNMERVSFTAIDRNDPTQLIIAHQAGIVNEVSFGQKMPLLDSPMETAILSGKIQDGVFELEGSQLNARFMPLIVLGEVIGTINVAHSDSVQFSQQNEQLLNQIALSTSSILESKMLFDQNQRALSETDSLYKTVSDLNRATTEREILETILNSSIADGYYRASFSRIETDEHNKPLWISMSEVVVSHLVENDPFRQGTRHYVPKLRMADLWINRPSDVIIIQNVQTDPEVNKELQKNLSKIGNKSMVFIPLHARGQWLGLLRIAWNIEREFSESDVRLLNVISEQASIVTNQITLFNEANARADQLNKLAKIEASLSQAITENDIVNSIKDAVDNPKSITLFQFRNDEHRNPAVFQQVSHWEDETFHEPINEFLPLTETHPIFNEWQIQNDQLIVVKDIEEHHEMDEQARESYRMAGLKSLILVPLINFGRWQGALEIGWDKRQLLEDTDLFMINQLVEPISASVSSIRALNETENLYEVSEKLNGAQSYRDVLRIFNEHSALSQRADLKQIIYFNKPYLGEDLPTWFEIVDQLREGDTLDKSDSVMRYKLSEFIDLEKLNQFEPVVLENLTSNQLLNQAAGPALYSGVNAQSVVSFPLNLGNTQLGYVIFYYKEKTNFFGFEVRELFRLIEQSAIAIQALRYLQQAESRAIREKKIREIAAKIRNSTSVESILRTAAKEVGNALGRHSVVYLETNGSNKNNN